MSVVTKYVPSAAQHPESGLGQAAGEQVPTGLQIGPERLEVRVRQTQRDRDRRLQRVPH